MFIELTDLEGYPIFINADKIRWITSYIGRGIKDMTILNMDADACVKVIESPDMIMRMIQRSENGT